MLGARRSRTVPWHPLDLLPEVLYDPAILDHTITGSGISLKPNEGTLGSAFDMQQTTDSLRPAFSASHADLNGRAAIIGDGADYLIQATANAGLDNADGEILTVVIVFRHTVANDYIWASDLITPASARFDVESNTAGYAHWSYAGNDGLANAMTVNVVNCGRWEVDTATNHRTTRVNDLANDDTTNYGAMDTGAQGLKWCLLGRPTYAGPFTGQLGFLMHIRRLLTAPELAKLTTWVNAQFGLSLASV